MKKSICLNVLLLFGLAMTGFAENLLINPGFKNGVSNWAGNACSITTVSPDHQTSFNGLQVTGRTSNLAGPFQMLTVADLCNNNNYTIEILARTYSGSTYLSAGVELQAAGKRLVMLPAQYIDSSWRKVSGSVTLSWSGTLQTAKFFIRTHSGQDTIYLKSASLAPRTYATASIKKPFPQNENYANRPAGISESTLNSDVKKYYDAWIQRYRKHYTRNSKDYYYVKQWDYHEGETGVADGWDKDWMYYEENGKKYTAYGSSEGLGYGMIITVLMAGYDSNAKDRFNKFLDTYNANPSKTGSGLMSWVIPSSSSSPRSDSATDGDMDVAYALYMAYKQWGDSKYYDKFKAVVKAIKVNNIVKIDHGKPEDVTYRLNLGDWVNKLSSSDPLYYFKNTGGSRSSDWMLTHLRLFEFYGDSADSEKWGKVFRTTFAMIVHIQADHSAKTGLMPDFVEGRGWWHPPSPTSFYHFNLGPVLTKGVTNSQGQKVYLESLNDDKYDYNACRFPWRLAIAYAHNIGGSMWNTFLLKPKLVKIANWIKKAHPEPKTIKAGYDLDGNATADWEAKCFTASLVSSCIVYDNDDNNANENYLQKGWNTIKTPSTEKNSDNEYVDYFNDSVCLLNMLLISGNWWDPPGSKGDDCPSWQLGATYAVGDVVSYNEKVYECLQAHTAYAANWNPEQAPALWQLIN